MTPTSYYRKGVDKGLEIKYRLGFTPDPQLAYIMTSVELGKLRNSGVSDPKLVQAYKEGIEVVLKDV